MKEYRIAALTQKEESKLRELESRFADDCNRNLVLIAWNPVNEDVAPESSSRIPQGE